MTPTLTGASWRDLEHAYGRAGDLPELLAAVSAARGWKLRRPMEDLCNRVLHQGTIYSASPPAVRALLPMASQAAPRDKKLFYEVLAEFASSARQAVRDGHATPCCSGGDPEHGKAILECLLEARGQIAPDLSHPDRAIRRLAAALLCCSADAETEAVELVRRRYALETDRGMRLELLDGLVRVRGKIPDWTGFLAEALTRESDPALRFALRYSQVREMKTAADSATATDLVAMCLAARAGELGANAGDLFEALEWLGPERELAGLLQALEGCGDRDLARLLAQRLLRLVFHDQRSGWESVSHKVEREGAARPSNGGLPKPSKILAGFVKIALMMVLWKIFPFLLRRRLRRTAAGKDGQRHKIEYWEVKGDRPDLPVPLTDDQRRALAALAAKAEVWLDQTNLWALFGLPDNAAGMRALAGMTAL